MATDGTGLKGLIPKLPAAHNGYIELYRNREVSVLQYEADKTGDTVAIKGPRTGKSIEFRESLSDWGSYRPDTP